MIAIDTTGFILMKLKYETSNLIKLFVTYVKNQFQTNVKCIRSNNDLISLLKTFT